MTYNVFGGTLNHAQSNPFTSVSAFSHQLTIMQYNAGRSAYYRSTAAWRDNADSWQRY